MTDELRADQVFRLDLGGVNAYLVDDGDVTLVDAGMPNDLADIRAEIEAAGYAESDIDRVLITHFDIDHVGTLASLAIDGPIYAMEPDASFLDGSRKSPLTNHKGLLQRVFELWLSRPSAPIERLGDGDAIAGFTAYHTPGHTPGHAVYVHADLEVGFLGDLVQESDGRLETPGWIISYSTGDNADSVRTLAAHDPPVDAVAMGHGEPLAADGEAALADLVDRLD